MNVEINPFDGIAGSLERLLKVEGVCVPEGMVKNAILALIESPVHNTSITTTGKHKRVNFTIDRETGSIQMTTGQMKYIN